MTEKKKKGPEAVVREIKRKTPFFIIPTTRPETHSKHQGIQL